VNVYTELRELRALVVELSAKLGVTQEQLQQQSAAVAELKRENAERPKVAFSAALLPLSTSANKDYGLFNTETNLVFGKVLTNAGNAYNPVTGVFTAPVKGVYYFRFTGYGFASNDMGLSIFKGNERMMSAYDYKSSGDTSDVISNGVTLLLEAGDVIYMRMWVNTWVRVDYRYDYTSFSGFLLFPV